MRRPVVFRFLVCALSLLSLQGCVSARVSDRETDNLFRQGSYEQAAERLQKGVEEQGEEGRDILLYLLDLGLAYHSAGKYEESNQALLLADQIAEIKDYTQLSLETSSLLVGDNVKHYKGEEFENVLISAYLAMNFALLGKTESALVEARRVNRKLQLMITEGKRKYQQNAFARYLAGILYESEGNCNDAYVDYKLTRELLPDYKPLGKDLWRMARCLGMRDEMKKWEKEYDLTKEERDEAWKVRPGKGMAEVIVLYENGISPRKLPNPQFRSLPKFYPRANPVSFAQVEVNHELKGKTQMLHDIEATAILNLEEKYGGLIAKKIAGVVAKEVVANQVAKQTGSDLLGAITRLVFYASDQADLRSWNLLPRDLQIVRIPVEPGTHTIRIIPEGRKEAIEKTVHVEKGKKVFVNARYMP